MALLLIALAMAIYAPQVSADGTHAENRPPNNVAETNARNRCDSEGWQTLRYGAIWFTNSASYYAGSVNVGATATTVSVNIRGSVFGCHNTSTNDTYAVSINPQGPNGWRLTGLSSTSLYRGASQGSHNWSTQGGDISAQLDVSGLAVNNQLGPDTETITIDIWRCFSTNSSTPTGTCYAETIPVTVIRESQPPNDPPVGSFTLTCTTLTMNISDPEGDQMDVRLIADGVDTSSLITNVGNGTHTFDISAWRDFAVHNFTIRIRDRTTGQTTTPEAQNIGPCVVASCSGSVTISPSSPEAGEQFTITTSFNINPPIGANGAPQNYSVIMNFPAAGLANANVGSGTVSAGQSSSSVTSPPVVVLTPGSHSGSFTVISGATTLTGPCNFTVIVTNKPYVSIYGGDVSAGGSFNAGNCNQSADILGFYQPGTGRGSSSQYAATALGIINEFPSAKMRTTTPQPLKGLTFANVAPGGGNPYGGGSGSLHCLGHYYQRLPSNLPPSLANSFNVTSFATEQRFFDPALGRLSLEDGIAGVGTIAVPNNVSHALYVQGDLIIRDNIVFSGAGVWANIDEIPSLFIIVQGNIFIESGVTQIDGVLVAEPVNHAAPVGQGTVYTCSVNGVPISASGMYNQCPNPLVVNGAVISQGIKLNRAGKSSLRFANAAEHPGGIPRICEAPLIRDVCAAETVSLGIETYLGVPFLPPVNPGKYDSITSLPPVL